MFNNIRLLDKGLRNILSINLHKNGLSLVSVFGWGQFGHLLGKAVLGLPGFLAPFFLSEMYSMIGIGGSAHFTAWPATRARAVL
jgi:hypothetical protein